MTAEFQNAGNIDVGPWFVLYFENPWKERRES